MFAPEARTPKSLTRLRGVAGVLLLSALIGLTPPAVHAQQAAASMKLSGHVGYSRISPPTSGVKLIEDIFQRVRSAPQIAMAQTLMKQQAIHQDSQNSGLLIRPKGTSNRAMPSPALALVTPTNEPRSQSLAAAFGGGGGTVNVASKAEPVVESWRGARQFPIIATNSAPRQSGMWEAQEKAGDKDFRSERNVQTQNVRPLGEAIGRFAQVGKALQDAQTMADQPVQIAAAPRARRAEQTSWGAGAAATAGAAPDSLGMDEEGEVSQGRNQLNRAKARSNERRYGGYAAPAEQAMDAVKAKEAARDDAPAGGFHMPADEKKKSESKTNKIAMADIALLPPNVVTGIPLVRLGASENQANGALQAIGSMKQLKVNKWTVWSWGRPQSKNGTSLQLYMRNGLLDAMRIFDPSLIGSDFGVNLGDSLSRVKEKFGEPAFILQEPGPGAGQNYVYPISQIGFQLARPAPGEQPRVVSVLIFNVK
jgi:hypothetical protein